MIKGKATVYKSKNVCSLCNNDNSLSYVNLECSLPRCISYTGGGGGGGGGGKTNCGGDYTRKTLNWIKLLLCFLWSAKRKQIIIPIILLVIGKFDLEVGTLTSQSSLLVLLISSG